ncbi:MAG: hypothetical protein PWP22_1576 [Thermoanaerobacter sp.]|nr:hypothetical protein [Thermoanaerobacter sp.]
MKKMKLYLDIKNQKPTLKYNEDGEIIGLEVEDDFVIVERNVMGEQIIYNILVSDTKKCTKCGEEKTRKEYYKHPSSLTGCQSYCKDCTNITKSKRDEKIKGDLVIKARRLREY